MLRWMSNILNAFLSCTLKLHVTAHSRCSDRCPVFLSARALWSWIPLERQSQRYRHSVSLLHVLTHLCVKKKEEFHDGVTLKSVTIRSLFQVFSLSALLQFRRVRRSVRWTECNQLLLLFVFPFQGRGKTNTMQTFPLAQHNSFCLDFLIS